MRGARSGPCKVNAVGLQQELCWLSLWSQSDPSSKDAGGWFQVRACQTLLGLWHPPANPQIRQDASPCPLIGAGAQGCCTAMALGAAPGEHPPPSTAWLRMQRWGWCLPSPQQSTSAGSWVKGCTDVLPSPVLLYPAQVLHVLWWMQNQTLLPAISRASVPGVSLS